MLGVSNYTSCGDANTPIECIELCKVIEYLTPGKLYGARSLAVLRHLPMSKREVVTLCVLTAYQPGSDFNLAIPLPGASISPDMYGVIL